jgi:hypothetical protein
LVWAELKLHHLREEDSGLLIGAAELFFAHLLKLGVGPQPGQGQRR